MTKEAVIAGMKKVFKEYVEKYNLIPTDERYGHAFDGTFWEGLLKDDSNIPGIVAKSSDERITIEIRSFWGSPEIDIRLNRSTDSSLLLVLTYSDYYWVGNVLNHDNNFRVNRVRVDGYNYNDGLSELNRIISIIES